jgi:ectoine hydroxylase-related dioxygenase (phytanoyl-CoA dioxygenase family)
MAIDFDMLIDKAPMTNTPTPWHQDAAYWIDMPDRRAVSAWVALDEATVDNGCMWFVPGSHLNPLRPHRQAGKGGGALECEATEAEGVPAPLQPGSATFHHGGTLHYSRGNSTESRRRAYIVNFRPEAMVRYEREQGYDHGRSGNVTDRKVRNLSLREGGAP